MTRLARDELPPSAGATHAEAPRFTGAVARGSKLFLATIGADRNGRCRLVASRSREFELKSREQSEALNFLGALWRFLAEADITRLTFSCSPKAGGHMAVAEGYKIEALLQLTPAQVYIVQAQTLSAFGNGDMPVPGPDRRRLSGMNAQHQSRAILTAAYAAHLAGQPIGGEA